MNNEKHTMLEIESQNKAQKAITRNLLHENRLKIRVSKRMGAEVDRGQLAKS
jgi:hypothetical protein